MSCSKMIAAGFVTSSRWARDTRDDFATNLREILSDKIFEHVQNIRNYFAPLGNTCEEFKMTGDCFETALRPLAMSVAICRKTIAVQ